METLVCAEGARDQMSGDNGEMPPRPARAGAEGEGGGRDGRRIQTTQTRDRGGGQGPHLHEQDFGRTIRGTG